MIEAPSPAVPALAAPPANDRAALYPFQVEACDAVARALQTHRSTLLVAPTGTGKTVMFAELARRFRPRGRILVLVHREELADQAAEKITRWTGLAVGVEMGARSVDTGALPDVVVASVPTLARETRRARFASDAFELIIVDEAHHAPARTYREVLQHFPNAKVSGVTATPDRLDRLAMGKVFESVAFVFEIRDAIEQGYLVPIRQRTVVVRGLDLSSVRINKRTKDLDEGELASLLMDEEALHCTAVPIVERAAERPTIVFGVNVAHVHALAEVLNRYRPGRALGVDGQTSARGRQEAVELFRQGQVQYLVNCGLFTEGFDAPATSCVAVARPTKSRALYAQMVGRGTRLSPATGKTDLLVLDFKGNAGRHRLINCADILDGRMDDSALAKATAQLLEQDEDVSVLDAIDEADAQLTQARRHSALTAGAHYALIEIDPFVLLGASNVAGRWAGIAATERQLTVLERNGIDATDYDRGQASALIDKIVQRSQQGLCTYKQARVLARAGLNPDVSFADAKRAIDALAANRWRPPAWLLADAVLAMPTSSPSGGAT